MAKSKRGRSDYRVSHKKSTELKKGPGRPTVPGKGTAGGRSKQTLHLKEARKVKAFQNQLGAWDQTLTNKRGECIPFAAGRLLLCMIVRLLRKAACKSWEGVQHYLSTA